MNTKPELRNEMAYEIQRAITEALALTDGNTKNCLNCKAFDEPSETCKRFNQRPPARVIALACQHHEDCNDIPF